MQDLLAELLWRNTEIDEAANRLCQTLPGFHEAEQTYEALSDQLRTAAGHDLYDRYFAQLIRYTNYEVQAYYSLGLGLREDIVKALAVQVPAQKPPLAKADSPCQGEMSRSDRGGRVVASAKRMTEDCVPRSGTCGANMAY